jgi:uncharacterized oxidoreductase
MKLSEQTVLITGGGSGVGRALAKAFHQRGNQVIICGRNAEKLQQTAKEIPGISAFPCDITNAEQIELLIEKLQQNFSGLSVLINNAAVQFNYDFLVAPPETLKANITHEININFTSQIQLLARCLPLLQANPLSAIVNISSGLALTPKKSAPIYCATKAALHSFTRSLRWQFEDAANAGKSKILLFEALLPLVDTPMTEGRGSGKISPDQAAQEILHGMERDHFEIRVGKTKLLAAVNRILPQLSEKILRNS